MGANRAWLEGEIKKLQAELDKTKEESKNRLGWCAKWEEENHSLQAELDYCKTRSVPTGIPPIVCLCGSTRFTAEMLVKQWELTKQGKIVLSWCALPNSYFSGEDKTHIGDQEGVKEIVDEVHLRKIDLADTVFVLNIDGYIGESTTKEIEYAKSKNKPIEYLEQALKGKEGKG